MATYKPGRFRRTLTPIIGTGSLITFYSPDVSLYENEITGVKITRGTNGRNLGYNPNILEIGANGRHDSFITGDQCRVFMREQQANSLAGYLGFSDGSLIAQRFNGRIGKVSLEDTGKQFHTTLAANSWLTQMNYSQAGFTPGAGQTLASLLGEMTHAAEPLRGINFSNVLGNANINHFQAGEYSLFKDGIDFAGAEIGLFFQERRDGTTRAWSHERRANLAANHANASNSYPIMRAQAISPGSYEQANERPAKRVEYTLYNATGGLATRVAEIANPTGELRETEKIDWSRWQSPSTDNQLYREAYARVYESSMRLYTIPKITIDLLMLLRQNDAYGLEIARRMLLLEVGEPIMLSGDWPPRLQGLHFADGITETITGDEWTFELSLVPSAVATGYTSPTVKPKAWDQYTTTWDNTPGTWDEA